MSDTKDLLVEIGTEELPPKALLTLSESFTQEISAALDAANLPHGAIERYATPRRLAVFIQAVATEQPGSQNERRGPALAAAFDEDGNPTKAAQGFARSCGVSVDDLDRMETDKGSWLCYTVEKAGEPTEKLFPGIVTQALEKLPIPKRMRWGAGEAEFVRPIHWVVMLQGSEVIPCDIMGIKAGNTTRGHRFHHPDALTIDTPANYASLLEEKAWVIASYEARRDEIERQVKTQAELLGGEAALDRDLLNEVTALVEWPQALAGQFDPGFLDVPHEALISTMQENQKYFAVFDADKQLLPHFITIANIISSDPQKVVEGNERVIRPRFADAAFFWEQDRKQSLANRIEALKNVTFQNKLGSIWDKTQRVEALASWIAEQTDADVSQAKRAAQLCKCDLLTDMVGEFPKLQGIAGRYYALSDGEAKTVAQALEEQYMPRHAGDALPQTRIGQAVSLADRIDTLMGIFGIGQKPTGAKDPFGLRRASLGVLRIMIESGLTLDLKQLLTKAAEQLGDKVEDDDALQTCFDYILERLKAYYQDQDIAADVIDAVMVQKPTQPLDFDRRIKAVSAFRELAEAESLAAANKRIRNILRKVETAIPDQVSASNLSEAAEKTLFASVSDLTPEVTRLFDAGDYEQALKQLASLRDPVDRFFDDVMVMSDDEALRNNRLALLNNLGNLFLRAADLSRLQH